MLFSQWQKTLKRCGETVALSHAATWYEMTFAQLQSALDQESPLPRGTVHGVSMSAGVEAFVIQTLRAWRDGAVLCPVERDVPLIPNASGELPAGICHLKITSGSTGEPRVVMFRAEQLAADAENICTTMKLDPASANVAIISVAHSYGFSNLILPLLLDGHPLIIASDAMPGSMRQVFALGKKVTLPAVPAMWRAWWQAGLLKDAPIALAISAGAPLPLELECAVFDECGLKIHNFLGSSECGGIAYDAGDVPRKDASYAGTAMQGAELSLNEENCLVVHSAAVAEGYWPPDENTLGHGRFVTSDLAEIRDDAVLLRGRNSDAINLAGRKLNPAEVECALLACEGVRHCVVFGVPSIDAARCEETVACISSADEMLTAESLMSWLGGRLPAWQVPRRYWFCQDLAPTERGKMPRGFWRERYLAKQGR
jgi:long-chain acyl-CoA synthetase